MFESLGVSNEDEVDVSNECIIPPVCPIIPNNECYAVNNVLELEESRPGPSGITGVSHEVEVNASLTNLVVSTTTSCSDTNSSRPAPSVRIYEWFVTTRLSKKKLVLKPMVNDKNDEENLLLC